MESVGEWGVRWIERQHNGNKAMKQRFFKIKEMRDQFILDVEKRPNFIEFKKIFDQPS